MTLSKDIGGHTLRGCVDWNDLVGSTNLSSSVTPYVGVWIETEPERLAYLIDRVTPYVGVWIETNTAKAAITKA